MKLVPLYGKRGKGLSAKVSDIDYARVMQYKWFARPSKGSDIVYVFRQGWVDGKHYNIFLHRFIKPPPPGKYVDHIDGDGLNNCRSNLRPATSAQNALASRKKMKNASSVYKGVSKHKATGKWQVLVTMEGGARQHVGLYKDEIDAARAYNEAIVKARDSKFVFLNFLPPQDTQIDHQSAGPALTA